MKNCRVFYDEESKKIRGEYVTSLFLIPMNYNVIE
jgi:hypothetical protein